LGKKKREGALPQACFSSSPEKQWRGEGANVFPFFPVVGKEDRGGGKESLFSPKNDVEREETHLPFKRERKKKKKNGREKGRNGARIGLPAKKEKRETVKTRKRKRGEKR